MYAHDVCHEYVLRGHDENDSYQHEYESNRNGDEPQRHDSYQHEYESQQPEGGNHDERCGHDTNARCDENRGAVGRGLPAHSSMRAFTSRRSRVGMWWLLFEHQTEARFRALHLALVLGLARNLVVGDRCASACSDRGE